MTCVCSWTALRTLPYYRKLEKQSTVKICFHFKSCQFLIVQSSDALLKCNSLKFLGYYPWILLISAIQKTLPWFFLRSFLYLSVCWGTMYLDSYKYFYKMREASNTNWKFSKVLSKGLTITPLRSFLTSRISCLMEKLGNIYVKFYFSTYHVPSFLYFF